MDHQSGNGFVSCFFSFYGFTVDTHILLCVTYFKRCHCMNLRKRMMMITSTSF